MDKTKEKQNKNKRRKIVNIIGYSICALLFVFVGYEIVQKLSGNSIYLFGVRSDVILTDSMSYKNEDPAVQSFLDGHDDQLQKGDLVYQVKVKEDTELKIYDIVTFNNLETGKLTTHRIVNIIHEKDGEHYVIRADTANAASSDGAYPRRHIVSKVVGKLPWMGNVVQFFQSFYGVVLTVGLIIIMVFYDLATSPKSDKKKLSKASEAEQAGEEKHEG